MDPLPLLNAPWMQPLVGLLVTALGSWLGSRTGDKPSGITQTATTHGSNSPVTQTVNQHTWHVSPPPPRATPESPRTGSTATTSGSDDDEIAKAIGVFAVLVVGISASTWAVASNWTAVSVTLRVLTLVALFITALTWWRWPSGVRGAWGLRITITAIGSALLWALTVLPTPAGTEPALAAIEKSTAGMTLAESVGATMRSLGLDGVLAYEMRLGGVALLIYFLYTTTSRGLGAVMAASGARRTPPRLWLVKLGNRLIGSGTMGFGYFAGIAAGAMIALALVHPVTAGWFLDWIGRMVSSPIT